MTTTSNFEKAVMCIGNHAEAEHVATHEAWVLEKWRGYCCEVFDHDWPEQRLIAGRKCEKVLKVETTEQRISRWIWRKKPRSSTGPTPYGGLK